MHDSDTSLRAWIDAKKRVEPTAGFRRATVERLIQARGPVAEDAPAPPRSLEPRSLEPRWSRLAWRVAFTLLALGVGLLRFAYLAVAARLIAS